MKRFFPILIYVASVVPVVCGAQTLDAVRVAVLPFEVFAADAVADPGIEVAKRLQKQLVVNPAIVVPDAVSLQSVLAQYVPQELTEERLRDLARLLGANFILYGSISKLGEEYSLDISVFNDFHESSYFKTFADGTDLDSMIESAAARVEQHMFARADAIPPAQRPHIRVSRAMTSPHFSGTASDLDAEIASVLNYEEAAQPAADAPPVPEIDMPVAAAVTAAVGDVPAPEVPVDAQPVAEMRETDLDEDDLDLLEAVQAGPVAEPASPAGFGSGGQVPALVGMSFDQPVNINADSLEYDNRRDQAVFNGHVIARQGDVTMYANRVRVTYKKGGGLQRLYATGNVKVVQGDRIATGDKIVFYSDAQKIVATGNPRVWQGENVVQGTRITVYLAEKRSVVEGTRERRVQATLFPGSMDGQAQP